MSYVDVSMFPELDYLKDSPKKGNRTVPKDHDPVDHPSHYTWLPGGLEVIDITENFNFTMGNALKYIMRAGHKGDPIEDLRKAIWYLNREIERREAGLDG